jgi:glycyl-tRNA synthetase
MDEAGTPFCVTVDFETLDDDTVTLRHRDSTEQVTHMLQALAVVCI